ncbi:Amino acid ABC transporter, amino acid-binding/permease protein [Streptococcus sp. DD10]|nr:ABC transporter substrate-binding protein [Streptococcus sp. DD10]KXT75248.1 Amino acid ABC transporter, amino acid-binding/permease protein [Streptococcus sp. DD10]
MAVLTGFSLVACSNSSQTSSLDSIKSKGKLVIALNPEFAPFEYQTLVDGKNTIVGSDVDLANEIAKELGVDIEISPMSFENVLASVQSGKADLAISGISKTEERSKVYDFSEPYYTTTNKLIVKKTDLDKYTSIDSLTGKSIGAQKGTVQENIAKNEFTESSVVSLSKNGNLITELKSGQLDAVIFEEPVAKGYVEKNPDLALADVNFEQTDADSYAIAMKKGSTELKEAVDKVITKLKSDGKLEAFIQEAYNKSIEN